MSYASIRHSVFRRKQWLGQTSVFRRKYGALNKETWPDDIKRGAHELWRVLKVNGTLIFKWADHDIPYEDVLKLFPEKPLFGQITLYTKVIQQSIKQIKGDRIIWQI